MLNWEKEAEGFYLFGPLHKSGTNKRAAEGSQRIAFSQKPHSQLKSSLKQTSGRLLLKQWRRQYHNYDTRHSAQIKFSETVMQRLILPDEEVDEIFRRRELKNSFFDEQEHSFTIIQQKSVIESDILSKMKADETFQSKSFVDADTITLTTIDAPATVLNDSEESSFQLKNANLLEKSSNFWNIFEGIYGLTVLVKDISVSILKIY